MDPHQNLWQLICDLTYYTVEGFRSLTNFLVKSQLDNQLLEHQANHRGSAHSSWCQFCKLEYENRRTNLEAGQSTSYDTVDWNSWTVFGLLSAAFYCQLHYWPLLRNWFPYLPNQVVSIKSSSTLTISRSSLIFWHSKQSLQPNLQPSLYKHGKHKLQNHQDQMRPPFHSGRQLYWNIRELYRHNNNCNQAHAKTTATAYINMGCFPSKPRQQFSPLPPLPLLPPLFIFKTFTFDVTIDPITKIPTVVQRLYKDEENSAAMCKISVSPP